MKNYKFSRKFLKAVALLTVFALFFLKIFINSIENNYKALSKLKDSTLNVVDDGSIT